MSKKNIFFKWWMTPKLPKEHLPIASGAGFRKYVAHYLVHPIRRRVAKYYLVALKKVFGLRVVAITGSAGKTTVKEMTASILEEEGNTKKSRANIDPVYNLPETILKCSPLTKYLVLEMGVEFKGEMDYYLWLARPDIAVVTNVYPTHTLYFGDVEGVAKEKGKLPKGLRKKDKAVLNKGNDFTRRMVKKTQAEVVWFGDSGDVSAKKVRFTRDLYMCFTLVLRKDTIEVELSIPGKQFVENALASTAAASSLGVGLDKIKKGLENYKLPKHRMEVIKHRSGAVILDDSYNNNPEAAVNALDTLAQVAGKNKKVVVMGDMLELGDLEKKEHKRIGKYTAKKKVDNLIGVGEASRDLVDSAKRAGIDARWVKNRKKVSRYLKPLLKNNTYVLIKASRSIGLDNLVRELS
jgi:UDP-N-acetylmuramoyl-tripeptide--D-alanyl-D-alanine ligase